MPDNVQETTYSDEEVKILEDMQARLKDVYDTAVRNYDKNTTDRSFSTVASQRLAIAGAAQGWIMATERLNQIKHGMK